MFDFQIKIAQTQDEIESAQRLRFDVFYSELGEKSDLESSKGLDVDKFDQICKHLIVVDKSKNLVIGTYRLLFSSEVNNIGFYSEEIFDIDNIKKIKGELLELGRSCIHRDYRNSAVINLLWNGIAWQVKERKVKYIFGCPRLDSTEPKDVNEAFALLRYKYYTDEKFRVYPLTGNIFKDLNENIEISNPRAAFRKLSALIRGYLNIGALICGQPAIDHELYSVVFFMLLPTDKIVNPYRRHFLGDNNK